MNKIEREVLQRNIMTIISLLCKSYNLEETKMNLERAQHLIRDTINMLSLN